MSQLTAIETIYNGYRFRSRLEARWAVFFDTLGVPYEYEKEGFELGSRSYDQRGPWSRESFEEQQLHFGIMRYLPDFWLPTYQSWVEIKPSFPDWAEKEKSWRLAVASGHPAFIFHGNPFTHTDPSDPLSEVEWAIRYRPDSYRYEPMWAWAECSYCTAILLGEDTESEVMPCCGREIARSYLLGHSSRLAKAHAAARMARFEHGEKPLK